MNLSRKEKEIISLLAQRGLKTKYDFFKKQGGIMSSSTAHNLINGLKEKGLIEVKKEVAFRIRGRPKKLYGLTFRGLLCMLKMTEIEFHLTENANELIATWLQKIAKVEEIFPLKQQMLRRFPGTANELRKASELVEEAILNFATEYPKEFKRFLQHYDLDFSTDTLIFHEIVNYSIAKVISKNILNRAKRRQLMKLQKIRPLFV